MDVLICEEVDDMTLRDILSIISKIDKISIHAYGGYVLFDGVHADLKKPVQKRIIDKYLDNKIDRVRAYNDVILVLLQEDEADD